MKIENTYACRHKPLLIRNRTLILTINKDRIFPKSLLENKIMDFKNGVINIQTTGYNGACTIIIYKDKSKH